MRPHRTAISTLKKTPDVASQKSTILPPTTHTALIPTLLSLLFQIKLRLRLPIPPYPLRGLPLRRLPAINPLAIQKALLHGLADEPLLLDALAEELVERGGAEAGEGVVHVDLLLAPLALEGVHGEELSLGGGALVGEAGFLVGQAGCEVCVGGEGGGEGLVGGEEGGVDGGGGVCEGVEEGWACEDVGDVLL